MPELEDEDALVTLARLVAQTLERVHSLGLIVGELNDELHELRRESLDRRSLEVVADRLGLDPHSRKVPEITPSRPLAELEDRLREEFSTQLEELRNRVDNVHGNALKTITHLLERKQT